MVGAQRASFSTTNVTADTNFEHFEQYPETAIMLYLLNSGNDKFCKLDAIDFLKLKKLMKNFQMSLLLKFRKKF